MIKVVVVDDHAVVREGLSLLVAGEEDFDLCAAADSGEHAVAAVAQHCPDVVLMDVAMPGIGGIDATRQIVDRWPDAVVVAMTTFGGREYVVAALRAGASGYLLKDAAPDDLTYAIRAAAKGQPALAPSVANRLMDRTRNRGSALSQREIEVLQLVADGLSNDKISKRLYLSQATIKSHLVHIYTKLNVDSRTAAVATAQRKGMLRRER